VQYAEKPMGETGVPDLTVWKETKSGQYIVKTGYTSLREGNLQTNGAPHTFWTIIWYLEIIPRVAIFYGRWGREHYQFKVFYTGEWGMSHLFVKYAVMSRKLYTICFSSVRMPGRRGGAPPCKSALQHFS
jgi:hypothetical protein